MKKLLPVLMLFLATNLAVAQSTIVSLIGEFTGWSEDAIMDNDLTDLNVYTYDLNLLPSSDISDPQDGIVEMKFRENLDWGVNWGAADFPTGTATPNGANILVPVGNYTVTFNKSTGEYSFVEKACGAVSIIGELTGWSDDIHMTQDPMNPEMWTAFIGLTNASDISDPQDGIVEMKFRQNADWGTNWGDAAFPTGTAVGGGDNIPVPVGSYNVTFNCSTGEYSFTSVPGAVGVVGEFTNWGGDPDAAMVRNGNDWSTVITVNESHDLDGSGFVDVKFRENSDWGTNWGVGTGADPLCDVGVLNANNIALAYGSYAVTFNDQTLAYCFTPTCGQVSIIGAFIQWSGDVNMQRSETDPNMWTLKRRFYADVEMKFRENADWAVNWGAGDFPSGTATVNGSNVLVAAGEYTISFNCSTGEYSFTPSTDLPCGEIGIIGAFNNFGTADPATDPATDVWMTRDPVSLSDFTLFYNFDASDNLYFREDAAPINNDAIWGGSGFPIGAGVKDVTQQIPVPGGKFNLHFNCITGFYEFERLGNSESAPKVFNITVDGMTTEADWKIDRAVQNVIDGDPMGTTDIANFGVTYNDEFIFVGVNVTDGSVETPGMPTENDHVVIFIDGDKSGGDYTDADIAFFVDAAGTAGTVAGNMMATVESAVPTTTDGYSVEAKVAWADLGVNPGDISAIGFDIIVQDVDGANIYSSAWNGNADNTTTTSSLGDMNLGGLECGNISMYSDDIGDVGLNTLTASPTTYVATFDFGTTDQGVVFRKDNSDVVSWGAAGFPSGTAALGGDAIPATAGRYLVSFDCQSLEYSFTDAPTNDCVANSPVTSGAVTIDGDLSEYALDQVMALVVDGGNENNTIVWGTTWDADNLYIAAQVTDGTFLSGSSVNPWEQDAVEVYIDGNHDADGDYDADKDVQLIIWDDAGTTMIWNNGGPSADVEAVLATNADGYTVEIKFPLSNIGFVPGNGRTIGFTIGSNDADNTLGTRENQIAWCGTGGNFNNTSDFGDLQFTGGSSSTNNVFVNNEILVYPNPASSIINIQSLSDTFDAQTNVRMFDLLGRTIMSTSMDLQSQTAQLDVSNVSAGIFFLEIVGTDGKVAIKKVVIDK